MNLFQMLLYVPCTPEFFSKDNFARENTKEKKQKTIKEKSNL
jgi:hypothetical protein